MLIWAEGEAEHMSTIGKAQGMIMAALDCGPSMHCSSSAPSIWTG